MLQTLLSRAQMQICTEEFAKYVIITVLTKGALVFLFLFFIYLYIYLEISLFFFLAL